MEYYDLLEIRQPAEREAWLMDRLPQQIAHAKQKTAHFARLFADVDARTIDSRAALAQLPITRKSNLIALQKATPPFGGLNATPVSGLSRVFASPGPIYDPEGHGQDWWQLARALFAAGFAAGDLVHNAFSYHFTPAGAMLESAAHKLGCPVFPAGVGQTEMQVQAIANLKPTAYTGTPSFLRIILEKADELGIDISSLKKAVVAGEPLPPGLRALFKERGIAIRQTYASADFGLIAYESSSEEGLLLNEGLLLEIVRPDSGEPVAEGEIGEIVLTSFNLDYPLIRFATGDLSAVLPGLSACGRTNVRIKGWLGRTDQTAKIKGMFVHPEQIADLLAQHAEVGRARLIIDNASGQDRITLHCEVANATDALSSALVISMRNMTKLRGEVVLCAIGTLPNDGKIIEDIRKFE